MATVSAKVDDRFADLMKLHDEVNWSAVVRKSIEEKLTTLEAPKIDRARVLRALQSSRALRAKSLPKTKEGWRIVREWRDKRR